MGAISAGMLGPAICGVMATLSSSQSGCSGGSGSVSKTSSTAPPIRRSRSATAEVRARRSADEERLRALDGEIAEQRLRAGEARTRGTSLATRRAELLDRAAVAVVGARACSPYGAQVARLLGRELAAAGLVVVSGLARGIDGEAHRGALEAGGPTVAVLGCGIDRDYPAAHAELARRIAATGLVASEYAPGVEPAPWRFPARNRIIAGLAAATVVVEARERSGALITADLALEEGREVFAVPGEITSALSAGTNALLRLGATALTSPADVLESLLPTQYTVIARLTPTAGSPWLSSHSAAPIWVVGCPASTLIG